MSCAELSSPRLLLFLELEVFLAAAIASAWVGNRGPGITLYDGVPVLSGVMDTMCSDPLCTWGGELDVKSASSKAIGFAQDQQKHDQPMFRSYRTILCPTANMNAVAKASSAAMANLEWVDPVVMAELARIACVKGQIKCSIL